MKTEDKNRLLTKYLLSGVCVNPKKLINEVGVDFLLANYDDNWILQAPYVSDYSYSLKLLLKYAFDDVIEYFNNLDYKTFNSVFYSLYDSKMNTILVCKIIDKLSKEKKMYLFNSESFEVCHKPFYRQYIYKTNEKLINRLIDDAVISGNYIKKYFNSDMPKIARDYIISKYGIGKVLDDMFASYRPISEMDVLYSEYGEELISTILQRVSFSTNYLGVIFEKSLPKGLLKKVLDIVNLDQTGLSYLVNLCYDYDSINYYFDHHVEAFDILTEMCKNDVRTVIVNLHKFNVTNQKKICNSFNDDIYVKLFKERYVFKDELELLMNLFEEKVFNAILKDINGNIDTMFFYINTNKSNKFYSKLFSMYPFTDKDLEIFMFESYAANEVKSVLYALYKDRINSLIRNRVNNFRFVDFENIYMCEDAFNYMCSFFNDDQLVSMLTSSKVHNKIKERIINLLGSKISMILLNLSEEDRNNIIIKFNHLSSVYSFLDSCSIHILRKVFPALNDSTKEKLFETRKDEVKILIQEESLLIEYWYKNYLFSSIRGGLCDYVFSLVDDDAIIQILLENNYYTTRLYFYHEETFVKAIENRIEYLYKNDKSTFNRVFNICVGYYSGLDIVIMEKMNFSSEDIIKIFLNGGICKKTKEVIYKKTGKLIDKDIEENKDDIEYLIKFLNKNMPDDLCLRAAKMIPNDYLMSILYDEDYVKSHNIGVELASKLMIDAYESSDARQKVKTLLTTYSKDRYTFVKNFNNAQKFLEILGINEDDFWQYALNIDYDYISDMNNILEKDIYGFKSTYEYFFKNIYSNNQFSFYSDFISLMKNYLKYSELCNDICNQGGLSDDEIINVKLLFSRSNLKYCPKSLKEVGNVTTAIIDYYYDDLFKAQGASTIKDIILELLFNMNSTECRKAIDIYGDSEEFEKLLFNNRKNKKLTPIISCAQIYIRIMEDILDNEDIDSLRQTAVNILDDYDEIVARLHTEKFDEVMRKTYAYESQLNFTHINSDNEEQVINKELTLQYGVPVYDFRDKKYMLYAHVKSDKEPMDVLVEGKSGSSYNFISFSAISYRNQKYYYNGKDFIFGYDNIPCDNFIFSSVNNMRTNKMIKSGSSEVNNFDIREQRGILDLSNTNGNSEILCYRQNIKPRYVIVPDGRTITPEVVDVCKKYNLTIALTQPINEYIDEPKEIDNGDVVCDRSVEIEELKSLRNKLVEKKNYNKKDFAIITDLHALYEPALSIVNDIHKNGISEIYSLGDNIGTGPNPSEVVNFLNNNGVKSIKGNHEHYMLDGVSQYKEHLDHTNGYEEADLNSQWTRNELSNSDIDLIKNYNDYIVLNVAGKKILLCHYLYDYNTNKPLFNVDDYDYIFQGHVHFKKDNGNIHTLNGAPFGNNSMASYVIVHVNENDITFEEKYVKFDKQNTINDMRLRNFNTREKMYRWLK